MDKNSLFVILYEISMSIGNSLEIKKMLNECTNMILSRLDCSSLSIYQKSNSISKLLYVKPKVLIRKKNYVPLIEELEEKLFNSDQHFLVNKIDNTYYYIFTLDNFGYMVLTKRDNSLDEIVLNSLGKINRKLVYAMNACIDNKKLHEKEERLLTTQNALEYQAYHDVLTGLPNRLLFMDRLKQFIYKAHRNKNKLAVLFIDMDRFKEVNDTFGHVFGDEVIIEVAKRIKSKIRETDMIARFGGDEFVMVFNEMKNEMVLVNIIQKIMQAMYDPIIIEGHNIYVTLSIGISIYPDDTDMAENLLKNSDTALYKAKNDGRNTYRFYTEDMTQKAFERMALETKLHQAIKHQEFLLYFQPQINVESDTIIGLEALVRWKDVNEEIITPNNFIPVAEETGLIISLGEWILKAGMQEIVKWYAKGLDPGRLAINISMLQLQRYDFISMLEILLKETMCKPQWLEIEVTESQVMKNPEQAILTLQKISDLGIGISIDDFGTGYSSLSYLKRLPINTLKIDQSFIQDVPDDEDDIAIVQAIIALAKSLNLDVIAEGVETEEEKMFLVENGCQIIQGFLYAKPMPSDDIEELLTETEISH